MRRSRFFLPTLKEVPAEAEIVSHRFMLRAGMIRKLAAGVYSMLPLGVMVVRKVEAIIREEMNRAGALEVFLPSIQPAELWKESGRWEVYGKELLRIRDRHDREFCYGPTHEEVVTSLVRGEARSYRDLPLNLYQIQTKFRDEIRPRFGVMRGREFSMKDAYSFDADDAGAEESYRKMKEAYTAIFTRLGLSFRAVEADTGQIGGSFSHEFMVMADSGEDLIAFCDTCEYAANVEKVELPEPHAANVGITPALKETPTPGAKTIEEVAKFLSLPPERFIKTLIYKTDHPDHPLVAALARGDHEINETKLARALGCAAATLAGPDEVARATGAPVGFAGPVGLKDVFIIADHGIKTIGDGVTGANKVDAHLLHVSPARDFPKARYADLRQAKEGDRCPRCKGRLKLARGIEVGHIFKLGTKYSEAMGATFLDKEGKERPMIMGCFGIGVTRTAAAAIEQNHDEQGVIWPVAIAPFKVIVLPLNMEDAAVRDAAEKLYADMLAAGLEPMIDDRDARPGAKFADADLMGAPVQVVVGKKSLANGEVELKIRKTGEKRSVALDTA
ncbi:MAG: proline--tRNA ligase, partial [Nitrospinae bacterium]|nr:proline--tRNA ligase [Nitrospinota bacterium]